MQCKDQYSKDARNQELGHKNNDLSGSLRCKEEGEDVRKRNNRKREKKVEDPNICVISIEDPSQLNYAEYWQVCFAYVSSHVAYPIPTFTHATN